MNSKGKSYWEKRQEQNFLAGEKKIKEYYKDLEKAFKQAKKEIQAVINDFYVRYADENGVSYADAQKSLDKVELGDLKDFIELVNKSMGKYNQKLNNMSIKVRITRYQALEKQIDAILQRLYAIEYQYKGEETLKEVYSDSYYRTWFSIDQYHGFHQEFAQINPRTIEELIKYPWSGADFSSRIWKQKDHMLQKLKESITTMIIQGKNPSTLSKDFAKIFKTKEYEAYRLLYTESSFIIEQGTLAAYKEDGVEKYQILATLDMKTSDICRSEDGKIYDVDKAVVGVNYPPYHPFCRTTTIPYYEDEDYLEDKRIARDPATGKTYKVPADMNYKEWHKKYIENNPEAKLAEKKWKNRYSDKKQYEKYKEVLGKDLGVKSLDEFQELKYNKVEEWNKIEDNYYVKSRLKDGTFGSVINPEKQAPHMESTRIEGKSYFYDDVDVQELFNKYAGTGRVERDGNERRTNKEIISLDENIGFVVSLKGVKQANSIKIHHSKKRTHIVPHYQEEEE
ncbi:phage putative head morphogenesis protein, SPP1 gp7 family [Caloranaerobacter azorensis DSM 13643]|uniref:Phage putative head morphogenesis protein, SPP1 gp7 family n=1 Tax=Caloranaerobacter azorensis DSM 13643 TaxID=1121264 RepID=A0A1M5TVQ0_9FIRM|nr:minor capsid protein [Caloranaerobacter azorensis]SHH54768.1 phage putative head morphogenesis protein, SPP1 gp7 family [Caloranaerobacter azorensis DSM 13643]